jgi:hypothetical protein
VPVSLFVYVALDNEGQLSAEVARNRLTAIRGQTVGLGDFRITFHETNLTTIHNYLVSYSPGIDKVKDVLMRSMHLQTDSSSAKDMRYMGLEGNAMPKEAQPNFIVYQVINHKTILNY